ncbi:DUF1450 domain-containing protein [Aquibacillus koreensis]|uniref:DUF1450 domain-containing protein n=1 Tax=Aquibacillus koreensis TaxID=279446 RepID=A0A9X3WIH2_9BACI|nr:DUF1450 domain-containing protein [Aquibacillus koreensis]MCT2535879.1 DUF1450 domain-containing protein [Aquibacillus koreensis]MDC3420335.1 DUF1450 domain-containing protein [Aquibacillus koreensis]
MNPIVVEFCINNIVSGSQKAKEVLEKDPDLDVVEYGCTSFCGLCAQFMVAIVGGEPIIADTAEELVEKVYAFIDENPLL